MTAPLPRFSIAPREPANVELTRELINYLCSGDLHPGQKLSGERGSERAARKHLIASTLRPLNSRFAFHTGIRGGSRRHAALLSVTDDAAVSACGAAFTDTAPAQTPCAAPLRAFLKAP